MANHKGAFRGCEVRGCDDEIAFVLAVLLVEYNDKFAAAEGRDGFGDGVEA